MTTSEFARNSFSNQKGGKTKHSCGRLLLRIDRQQEEKSGTHNDDINLSQEYCSISLILNDVIFLQTLDKSIYMLTVSRSSKLASSNADVILKHNQKKKIAKVQHSHFKAQ